MIEIEAFTPGFAADVRGVDLRALDDEAFAVIHAAWLEYGVIRVRGQQIGEDELQQFSARFGPLEEIPLGRMSAEQRAKIPNRFVTQLSNIRVDGKPIGGLGNDEANWHSDMTYVANPPPASILLAVEVPAEGGNTQFADQRAAFAAMPTELREHLATITIKHDAAHTSIGKLRPGYEAFDDPRDAPGAVHPAILEHPETGRPALYLGRREWACIPGLPLDESEALLDEIWAWAARPEYVWTQVWEPGDVICWDNRSVLHRRDGFAADSRRLMKRCQVLAPESMGATAGA